MTTRRPSPNRWPTVTRRQPSSSNGTLLLLTLLLLTACFLLPLVFLRSASAVLPSANALGRRCGAAAPQAATVEAEDDEETAGSAGKRRARPRIAMVSFSDEGVGGGGRSFRGLADAVGRNKRAYAGRMGYRYVDARDLVDPSRPASWSKILAVRSQLPLHDWVFWNDADTIVTNPNISLESILQAAIGHGNFHASPDLVVTEDFNGVNAGVFFVRRSRWSEEFLETWWNQTSFVQFGSSRSGDNFALQYLLDNLPPEERRRHVRASTMQCLFNSYPWVTSSKSIYRLITLPGTTWQGVYSDGDFMVHLAGLDDKKSWVDSILEQLRTDD